MEVSSTSSRRQAFLHRAELRHIVSCLFDAAKEAVSRKIRRFEEDELLSYRVVLMPLLSGLSPIVEEIDAITQYPHAGRTVATVTLRCAVPETDPLGRVTDFKDNVDLVFLRFKLYPGTSRPHAGEAPENWAVISTEQRAVLVVSLVAIHQTVGLAHRDVAPYNVLVPAHAGSVSTSASLPRWIDFTAAEPHPECQGRACREIKMLMLTLGLNGKAEEAVAQLSRERRLQW
ncbi:hypothetical protein JCM3770_005636 [Rhodotorula araucariae]